MDLGTWEQVAEINSLDLRGEMNEADVRRSVRHSTIHTEKSNKMEQCIKIYYSLFI